MTCILVIEDEQDLREEIVDVLTFEGYDVLEASDGITGLQLTRDYIPDVVLCDIAMPQMNGFEVLRELQNESATAVLPFIFLTAHTDREQVRRGMELGADDYLTKPFLREELLSAIDTQLYKRTQRQVHHWRAFSQRLTRREEHERRRLAEQFQMDIVGMVTGLKVMLDSSSGQPPQIIASMAGKLQQIVDKVLTRTQEISQDLWPTMLQHLGLLPTLMWYFQRYQRVNGIQVNFVHDGLQVDLPEESKIAAYYIIQEALANVVQHASVSEVNVNVYIERERLLMQIADDGPGFDLDTTLNSEESRGLWYMQERAAALGGECVISTMPEGGTLIVTWLPMVIDAMPMPLSMQHNPTRQSPTAPPRKVQQQRIILAEENELIRGGLHHLLESNPAYTVIGEAGRAQGLQNLISDLEADVLLLSFTLCHEGLLELVKSLVQNRPHMKVIVLSPYSQLAYARAARRSGAAAYVIKQAAATELQIALEAVLQDDVYVSPACFDADNIEGDGSEDQEVDVSDTFSTLTNREREIFFLVLQGKTNVQIASELVISSRTVETHRSNLMRKLGVRGQAALMHYALNNGLVVPGS